MKVWENYFEKNPKYEGMKIVSIVFEDEGSTFTKQCLQLVNRRDNPIVVGEYVYHSASLSKLEIKSIIKSLQEMDYSNTYKDATKKCLFYPRLSVNPPPSYKVPDKIAQHIGNDLFNKLRNYREWNGITNENKQYKNMNKKNTMRLTESDLKRIISESVKKVLKENIDRNQTQKLVEDMSSQIMKLTSTIQLHLANAISKDFEKGSIEYNEAMEARNQAIELSSELNRVLCSTFLPLMDYSYERFGY